MLLPSGVTAAQLTAVLDAMLERHEALRLRLTVGADGAIVQTIDAPRAGAGAACVRRVDMAGLDARARQVAVREASDAAAAQLDPERGVMLQAVWCDDGSASPGELLLVAHHLAIDGVSWRVLMLDLEAAWDAVRIGQRPALGAIGTSFRRWATLLSAAARRPERVQELEYWRAALRDPARLTTDLDPARDTFGRAGRWTQALDVETTAAVLTHVPTTFHAGVNDVLLTALVLAAARWRRRRRLPGQAVALDLEGHGREEQLFPGVDLSRTIGWFTTVFPLRCDVEAIDLDEAAAGGPALGEAVKTIKEQLRRVPDGGLGFGLLRYSNPDTASALAGPAPQLGFNYFGRMGASGGADRAPRAWQLVTDTALGGHVDPALPLAHVIEVNAVTRDGADGPRLHAHWTWASALLPEAAVRELAQDWFALLDRLVQHAAAPGAGGFTPSDVALAGLTQADIDALETTMSWAESRPVSD